MDGYNYNAERYDYAASTVKIEEITLDYINRDVLRKLKENDPNFDKLMICKDEDYRENEDYCPDRGAYDLGWLGFYVGKNTVLEELRLRSDIFEALDNKKHKCFGGGGLNYNDIEPFFRGVNNNKSIRNIMFDDMDLSGGDVFQLLLPFFENNHILSEFVVDCCVFESGCARQLSLALRCFTKSLQFIWLENNQMGDGEQLAEIIEALSMHPQLTHLHLCISNIGRNECMALANFLRHEATQLSHLKLHDNEIDDEGVDALAGALLTNSRLVLLDVSYNHVTARGCQSLVAVLQNPKSNLEALHLHNNNIGDDGALVLANIFTFNRKLEYLSLSKNGITAEGWSAFSKPLCDTSSVNKTFLSNHSLSDFGKFRSSVGTPPHDVRSLLALWEQRGQKSCCNEKDPKAPPSFRHAALL